MKAEAEVAECRLQAGAPLSRAEQQASTAGDSRLHSRSQLTSASSTCTYKLRLRPPQVEAWRKAAAQAQQAVELLARASRLLAGLLERHKLQGQKVGRWKEQACVRAGWRKHILPCLSARASLACCDLPASPTLLASTPLVPSA